MNYIVKTILLFTLLSCSKDIEVNYQVTEHKLVLDCVLSSNVPVKVYLSTNTFMMDAASAFINDAQVLLYENKLLVDTLINKENGHYLSKIVPIAGKEYHITAKAKGLEEVSASETLPKGGFDVLNVEFKESVTVVEDVRFDLLSLDIVDSNPDENYYELAVFQKPSDLFPDLHPNKNKNPEYIDVFYVSNSIVSMRSWDLPYPKTILFTDKMFNQGKAHFDVFVHNNALPVIMKLRQVSKQYYDFKRILYLHQGNQLSERETIEEFFKGEPIDMYSNIKNGYGVFAGYVEIEK